MDIIDKIDFLKTQNLKFINSGCYFFLASIWKSSKNKIPLKNGI